MEAENVLLNVQVPKTVRDEFKIVATNRGTTMSALVYQFVLKTIREEKAIRPETFPDYDPPPFIVGETNLNEMLMEALNGKELTPEMRRAIEIAIRTALEVQEITEDGTKIK